jgi:effector-binding domain-containing protein
MGVGVHVRTVQAEPIAAVRRRGSPADVKSLWKPALDLVWAFLRQRPGLRTDGHNVFVYHHPSRVGEPMDIEFGVQVVRAFVGEGEVVPAATPAGEVATATHVGPYDGIGEAHAAIRAWATAHGRSFAGRSWEVYGDWNEDPARLHTDVLYLLA